MLLYRIAQVFGLQAEVGAVLLAVGSQQLCTALSRADASPKSLQFDKSDQATI